MKQCPACKNTYTDDSLRFCLADGATLTELGDEQPTVVRTTGRDPVRIDIPVETGRREPTLKAEARSGSLVLKVVIGVLLLGSLGLVGAGVAGAIYFMNSGAPTVAVKSPTPLPTPSPSPTIDTEKEKLQKELANLQKKLEEATPEPWKTPPGFESDELPTASVNSPNDGFLALRSAPDAEKGKRLARIPHGTVVVLETCEKEKVTIGSRTGRWCMVSYGGQTGWVFDARLIY